MSDPFIDLPFPIVQSIVDAVFDSVPTNARRSQESIRNERAAATAALIDLQPTDAIEAGIAVRIVTAHHSAVDNLRRAALPDVPDALAIRLRGNANTLSRMAERLTTALQERQAMGRALRQAAALEAAMSAPYSPEPAAEEICEQNPMPSENGPPPPATNPSPKPYRVRLEQRKVEKQAARAARMGVMTVGDVTGEGSVAVG